MTREANAGRRKAAGNRDRCLSAPPPTVPDNWPDTGADARTREGADAGQVSLYGNTDNDTGTEGQVGRHDNDSDGDAGCGGKFVLSVFPFTRGSRMEWEPSGLTT